MSATEQEESRHASGDVAIGDSLTLKQQLAQRRGHEHVSPSRR